MIRCVKERYIPAAQTKTYPTNASYELVIEKGREVFFPDEINENDCFALADSGGVPKNRGEWCGMVHTMLNHCSLCKRKTLE